MLQEDTSEDILHSKKLKKYSHNGSSFLDGRLQENQLRGPSVQYTM